VTNFFVLCRVKFDVNEWRLITVLYRRKTKDEMKPGRASAKRRKTAPSPTPAAGDYSENSYQFGNLDTPYEFVAVFSSLAALMISVKAWTLRRLSGWVQIGMDNIYNMLKDCPHVTPPTPPPLPHPPPPLPSPTLSAPYYPQEARIHFATYPYETVCVV